jgi:hypothetical protein
MANKTNKTASNNPQKAVKAALRDDDDDGVVVKLARGSRVPLCSRPLDLLFILWWINFFFTTTFTDLHNFVASYLGVPVRELEGRHYCTYTHSSSSSTHCTARTHARTRPAPSSSPSVSSLSSSHARTVSCSLFFSRLCVLPRTVALLVLLPRRLAAWARPTTDDGRATATTTTALCSMWQQQQQKKQEQ